MFAKIRKVLTHPPLIAGIATVLFSAGITVANREFFQKFIQSVDNRATDWMFQFRGQKKTTGRVVIVDIDEKSLGEIGQWPWPRNRVAELLKKISACEPTIVGLDIFFPEKDRTSPRNYVEMFREATGQQIELPDTVLDYDVLLGETVAELPVILGYMFVVEQDAVPRGDMNPFPTCNIVRDPPEGAEFPFLRAYRPILNVPDVGQFPRSEGFLNTIPDRYGTIRQVPLFLGMALEEEKVVSEEDKEEDLIPYPSLAMEMLRVGAGEEGVTIHADAALGIKGITLGDQFIPADSRGWATLNWRGSDHTFPYISATDVMHGRIDPSALRDKYILVGSSAAALFDLRACPMDPVIPGLEIHATLIDNVLADDVLQYDPAVEAAYVIAFIVVGGTILSFLLAYAPPILGASIGALMFVAGIVGNYHFFFLRGYIIGGVFPGIALVLIFIVVTVFNYFYEGRQKRYIRSAFSHYVSSDVVSELVKNPDKLSLTGELRILSVMFSDIRGFTTISEGMSAKELSELLNEYLTEMTDIVIEYGGTVDKFIGDAIMAFWGAPLDDEEHALHAVRTGLRMLERLRELQVHWEERGLPHIDIGIGVNTGPMNVGNMGSQTRFDYTAIGDNVNLGSRLEGLNKEYGTKLLISESTLEAVGGRFFCRLVDLARVKGKDVPIRIYEPLLEGEPDADTRTASETFEKALELYAARDWDGAQERLTTLNEQASHPLYELYLERIEYFRREPPPADWDGAFTHTKK